MLANSGLSVRCRTQSEYFEIAVRSPERRPAAWSAGHPLDLAHAANARWAAWEVCAWGMAIQAVRGAKGWRIGKLCIRMGWQQVLAALKKHHQLGQMGPSHVLHEVGPVHVEAASQNAQTGQWRPKWHTG